MTALSQTTTSLPASGGSLNEAFEDLFDKLQGDEPVDVEAYIREHPQHAGHLRKLLPTMTALAELGYGECMGPLSHSGQQPIANSQQLPNSAFRTPNSALGGTLGDFRILRELGRGGMGVVYEAEQISLSRRVALKILPFAAVLDPRQLQRFKNEALAAAHLDHPNIVNVYGVGCERGVHYYAMRLIEGASLAEVISRMRNAECGVRNAECGVRSEEDATSANSELENHSELRTPNSALDTQPIAALTTEYSENPKRYFRRIAELAAQAAEALDHAHEMGIVHRDVKPSNLMLETGSGVFFRRGDHGPSTGMRSRPEKDSRPSCAATPKLWITDFGLARFHNSPEVTATGDIVGTLRYMSPEQALAKRVTVDHRTDIYSLGVTLYELATLAAAFEGDDRETLFRRIAFEDPRRPRQIEPRFPADLETIIQKAIEKNPEHRYQTAAELADDLGRFAEDEQIRARPPSPIQRMRKWSGRHRSLVAAAVLLFVVTSVLSGVATVLLSVERNKTTAALGESNRQRARAERNLQMARQAFDDAYVQVAEKILADEPYMQPAEREFMEKALAFYENVAREQGTSLNDKAQLAEAYLRVAAVQNKLGNRAEAEKAALESIRRYERLVQESPSRLDFRLNLAKSVYNVADIQGSNIGGGLPAFRRAADLAQQLVRERPDVAEYRELAIEGLVAVAKRLNYAHKWEESREVFAQTLALSEETMKKFPGEWPFKLAHAGVLQAYSSFNSDLQRTEVAASSARESAAILRAFLATNPRSTGARQSLVAILSSQARASGGDERMRLLTEAIDVETRLAADFPDVPGYKKRLGEFYWDRAKHLMNMGQHGTAIEDLEKAIEHLHAAFAVNGDAYTGVFCYEASQHLAQCQDAIGEEESATRTRAEAEELIPRIVEAQEIVDGDPASYFSRARLYERLGKSEDAVTDLGKAIELDPHNAEAFQWRAEFLMDLGRVREAQTDITEANRLQPDNALTHFTSSQINGRLNDWQSALADLNRAIELDPQITRFFENRANAHEKLGNYAAAVADREAAVKLGAGPAQSVFHLHLAELLARCPDHRLRDYARALQLAEEAIKLQTYNHWSYLAVAAEASWRLGHKEKASGYARAFVDETRRAVGVRFHPDNPYPLLVMAWEIATWPDPNLGSPGEVQDLVDRALKLKGADDGTKVFAARVLGLDHLRTGNWTKCIAAIEEPSKLSIRADWPQPNAIEWFALTVSHWQLGHHEEARNWREKAVAWMDNPDNSKWEGVSLTFELDNLRAQAEQLMGKQAPGRTSTEESEGAAVTTRTEDETNS